MGETKRRNHYVPRFLLNRFASRTRGAACLVWQLSKDRAPIEISTRDAGVQAYFYGEPDNSVENRLQAAETVQAEALARLDGGEAPELNARTLRQLMWMLAVRTRALRRHFVAVGATLLDNFEESSGSAEARAAIKAQAERDFDRILFEHIAKLPPLYRDRALLLLRNPARLEALRDFVVGHLEGVDFKGFMASLRAEPDSPLDLSSSAALGQIRGLSSLLDREEPPDGFSPAYWKMIVRPPGTFVLGDGCVFALSDDGRITSLLAAGAAWRSAYLPICDRAALVAAPGAVESILSDDQINAASVELSADVFFASRKTEREAEWTSRIGCGEPLVAGSEIARVSREAWRNAERAT